MIAESIYKLKRKSPLQARVLFKMVKRLLYRIWDNSRKEQKAKQSKNKDETKNVKKKISSVKELTDDKSKKTTTKKDIMIL